MMGDNKIKHGYCLQTPFMIIRGKRSVRTYKTIEKKSEAVHWPDEGICAFAALREQMEKALVFPFSLAKYQARYFQELNHKDNRVNI